MRAFTFREKIIAFFLAITFVVALGYWSWAMFMHFTVEGPKEGGVYTEAIFGQPTYFNPLLLTPSNDAEASVIQLVYSSLFRADGHGAIVPDIAERYEVSDDNKVYTVFLRKDVRWHDGESLTAEDVVFTFNLVKNTQFDASQILQDAWADISVERVDDYTVRFVLKKPYAQFISQLRTGILPQHIWNTIEPEAFKRTVLNTEPIGSGPYILDEVQTDKDGAMIRAQLRRFEDYYGNRPYIDRITLSFFDSENDVSQAFRDRVVMGASVPAQDVPEDDPTRQTAIHDIVIPTYFAVFFNPLKSAALGYDEVRRALAMATERSEIVDQVLFGKGIAVDSPLFTGMTGYQEHSDWPQYDMAKARELLEKNGWKAGEDGIRAKDGTVIRFTLIVPAWDNLQKTAEILRKQWRAVGADVEIVTPSPADLSAKYLGASHEYDALLYGQSYFSFHPAPLSFWHSSQKKRLNFAQLENKEVDKYLEQIQLESDDAKREELYHKFSAELAKNVPAVFLYTPYYEYAQDSRVFGVDITHVSIPAERFATISQWYLHTKRVLP